MNWITESNRQYHLFIGIASALIGTVIGAILVAAAMEGKDCQSDPWNEGIVPWKWNWRKWDWLDFLATIVGGLVGQGLQLIIVHYIFRWI